MAVPIVEARPPAPEVIAPEPLTTDLAVAPPTNRFRVALRSTQVLAAVFYGAAAFSYSGYRGAGSILLVDVGLVAGFFLGPIAGAVALGYARGERQAIPAWLTFAITAAPLGALGTALAYEILRH